MLKDENEISASCTKIAQFLPILGLLFSLLDCSANVAKVSYKPISYRKKSIGFIDMSEAVAQKCFVKKMFLEIAQNSQKTPEPESLFLVIKNEIHFKYFRRTFPLLERLFWRRLPYLANTWTKSNDVQDGIWWPMFTSSWGCVSSGYGLL